jgi:hypothetical protein
MGTAGDTSCATGGDHDRFLFPRRDGSAHHSRFLLPQGEPCGSNEPQPPPRCGAGSLEATGEKALGGLARFLEPGSGRQGMNQGGGSAPPLFCQPPCSITAQRQLAAVGFLGVWAVMERAGPAVDLKRGRTCPTESKMTYRVKLFLVHSCAWRVVKFNTLAAACRWRSQCESRGWLATLMPPEHQ